MLPLLGRLYISRSPPPPRGRDGGPPSTYYFTTSFNLGPLGSMLLQNLVKIKFFYRKVWSVCAFHGNFLFYVYTRTLRGIYFRIWRRFKQNVGINWKLRWTFFQYGLNTKLLFYLCVYLLYSPLFSTINWLFSHTSILNPFLTKKRGIKIK